MKRKQKIFKIKQKKQFGKKKPNKTKIRTKKTD